ncbi:hypothetical protein AAC387_Pa09g2355 [Persea americana]
MRTTQANNNSPKEEARGQRRRIFASVRELRFHVRERNRWGHLGPAQERAKDLITDRSCTANITPLGSRGARDSWQMSRVFTAAFTPSMTPFLPLKSWERIRDGKRAN